MAEIPKSKNPPADPDVDSGIPSVEETLLKINKRINQSNDFCEDYFEKAKGYYKLYRSHKEPKKNKWESNIFVPYTFTLIENSVAREMTTEFSRSPYCCVVPTYQNGEIDNDITQGLEKLINYYLENPEFEFYLEYKDHLKNQKIYGNGDITIFPKMDMDDPLHRFLGPRFEAIDYWDRFPDPSAKRGSQARYMIYRKLQPWDYIENKMDEGLYKKYRKSEVSETIGMYFGDKHSEAVTETGRTANDVMNSSETKYEELKYCSGGDVVVVLGGSIIVQDTRKNKFAKTPYAHPFNESRYVTHSGEYFGSGYPELCKGLQVELNLVRNQRRDNLTLTLNKMFKLQMNEELDDDDLISEPGGVIRLMNMGNLEAFEFEDVTQNAYQEESVIKSDIENTTGEFTYSRGGTPERRETATAIVRLQNASQPRFTMNMQESEINCFRQICKKTAMLCHKFQDEADMAKIIGKDRARKIKALPADDLARSYGYKFANTDLSGMKEMRVNMLSQALEMCLKIPPQATQQGPNPYVLDTRPIAAKLFSQLDFINVEGDIIKDATPPPPVQPEIPPPGMNQQVSPQQLMAMMAQGQPPQGGLVQ